MNTKKIIKYVLVIALTAFASCTSSKQVVPVSQEPVKKSYKLPACHKAMHEYLIKNQNMLIITSVSLNFDELVNNEVK